MTDDLLGYYNNELKYIRQHADRFAKAHPKVAERLRLNPDDASDDPHVERLIEAFAYLTARVRQKLDDEFPELTGSLLDVLYPHYQAPIPSMAVVKFEGLRKPPALRLMLMILLFSPSATPLVIGCFAKRRTPSR